VVVSRVVGAAAALLVALGLVASAAADSVTQVPGTSLLVGVACPTAAACVATGQAGAQESGVVVATNDKGNVQGVSSTNELYGVACATETKCFAVGTGDFASNGKLVPVTGGLAGPPGTVSQTEFLRGIACPTSSFCVAVGWAAYNGPPYNGRIGVVVPIVNGTASAVEIVSGTPGLEGVSCPTSSFCVAVGDENMANSGAVVVPITNGTAGGVATVSSSAQLNAIACPSAAGCFAVGSGAGNVSMPVVVPVGGDGTPGSAEQVPGAGQGTLAGIDCQGPSACWAAGWGPTGIVVPIRSGVVGSAISEPGAFQLYSVSCPPSGPAPCVAVGDSASAGVGVVLSIGATSGPWKMRDKAAAKSDLTPALQNAVRFCTPTALGLAGFGTGVLLIGSSGSLAVAGLLTAYATEPFCLAVIKRVLTDYQRFVKDPPASNITKLATPAASPKVSLPSCKRWHGSLAAFCTQLRKAEGKWAEAAGKAASISQALETTQTREAEALAAGNQAAANSQDNYIPTLEKQEHSALKAELEAAKAVAQTLSSHHIGYRMTKSQSRSTISAVEHTLAKKGIATSELKTLGGAALRPQRTNLIKALSGR
jgi:hypothetical protein